MTEIKKVAVMGSGVMGASIAAHLANAGIEVLLFDIVLENAQDRSELAQKSIQKLLITEPQAFVDDKAASLVTPYNLEDHFDNIKQVNWVIEAVVEKLDIKRALYQRLIELNVPDLIVSSNTSTIPLNKLLAGLSQSFAKRFLITHFFNPPRYMKLLEVVKGPYTLESVSNQISEFARIRLGKKIVYCKDTAGFIANRIGCFWLEVGIKEALTLNVQADVADTVISTPFGIPKTGIFGLVDLIGLDVMKLISQSFIKNLPPKDRFCQIYSKHSLIEQMLLKGLIGRKGPGGFYRINKKDGIKTKQVINFKTGDYIDVEIISLPILKSNITDILNSETIEGIYSWKVMSEMLAYVANLIPEISDEIYAVDQAMKKGFNWKYGPFELIDKLGDKHQSGAEWLISKLESENRVVPKLLKQVGKNSFYRAEQKNMYVYSLNHTYKPLPVLSDEWQLSNMKANKLAVYSNNSCNLWDIGNNIVCLEINSKMNTLNTDLFLAIEEIIPIISKNYQALVIGSDTEYFSAGADLKFMLEKIQGKKWKEIEQFITHGQNTMSLLKYTSFPIVTAASGIALGGGAELILHSHFVQPYIETYMGLVEIGVGLIPGFGGCKEIIYRFYNEGEKKVAESLLNIILGKTAKSATQAIEMFNLTVNNVTFNRDRLLNDAKNLAISSSVNFFPKREISIENFSASKITAQLKELLDVNNKYLSNYDKFIADRFIEVFLYNNDQKTLKEQDLFDAERSLFFELIRNPMTEERIEHMLKYNKKLDN
ncbi:putative 3-hydroxyacyl-CoA dehydrogenase [Rickettsiales bacterium Ac37b]|nr:putative 3-hydroxyacyl-CoA dehydrogenase [Rickettsiales bacterium Ac37b]